jgi:cell wall-associated NlpC family hydrolase
MTDTRVSMTRLLRPPQRSRRRLFVAIILGLGAVLSGCASHGPAIPQPFPQPGARNAPPPGTPPAAAPDNAPELPAVAPSLLAQGVVSTALQLVGTPYRNGGADPGGFDCSGFVQYVFSQQGVSVPRTVDELARSGTRVDEPQLQPGDLVFFHTSGRGATHVGIAIDCYRFVHAPSSRGEVRVEPITRPYWAERFMEARRVVITTAP